jgi:malonyl-CoA O-methyltransferase
MDHVAAHNTAIVPDMDPVAAERWRNLPRQSSPWLHEEIGGRMVERLGWFKQAPQAWLDWSPMLGGLATHRRLRDVYPDAAVWIAGDQAEQAASLLGRGGGARAALRHPLKWWASAPRVQADPGAIEIADMVWANMALHLNHDPSALLQRWRQLLRVGGFLMFSGLGPDTLREVRAVYAQKGWHSPAHALTDMHDWGDMLVETGFAEPVMDMERLTLTYPNAERLLHDLRDWGRNLHAERPRGLCGRSHRHALVDALESGLPRTEQGLLSITVEVIYGHAFKTMPKVKLAQSSTVSVADMRAMLRGGNPR